MSSLYAAAQAQMLGSGGIDWASADLAVIVVNDTYTPDFIHDTSLDNIPEGAQMCDPTGLIGATVTAGVAGAANVALSGVDTTTTPVALVIMYGYSGTYNLIAYINDGLGFGAPFDSSTVQILWDIRGIFSP